MALSTQPYRDIMARLETASLGTKFRYAKKSQWR